nr:MAG TPA: hypothetical protein [Caudoviricetes sp.]
MAFLFNQKNKLLKLKTIKGTFYCKNDKIIALNMRGFLCINSGEDEFNEQYI